MPDKRNLSPILGDYKKIGSKFVPPLLHRLGPWVDVSYSRQVMPELVWWDVLAHKESYRFAAQAAEELAAYFKSKNNLTSWKAFISDYSRLSETEVNELRTHLDRANILDRLEKSLSDFVALYPKCPLSKFLDLVPSGVDSGYLKAFETRLSDLEDKRSRHAVLVQAQAVYMGFLLEKLRVANGLALADFPEVERYPSTDRSIEVGLSVCSVVNMMAGSTLPNYSDDSWVNYFWERSAELHPLDFGHLEDLGTVK